MLFEVEVEDESPAHNRRASREVMSFSPRSVAKLRRAIELERATHRYVNRTYTAEHETRLSVASDDGNGNVDVSADMSVEYASFLNDRGWSEFESRVRRALNSIQADAEKLKG